MARKARWEVSGIVDGMATVDLHSWRYFYDYVHQELLQFRTYVFRGQRCSTWQLGSTLDRLVSRTGRDDRRKHLDMFRRATRGRRGLNPPMIPDDHENDWWALGQHFGLATPLLDWSLSPFVAAYFAFCGEPMADQTSRRAIYALAESGVASKSTEIAHNHQGEGRAPIVEFVRPQSDENPRLVNQGGLFTRCPDGETVEQWVARHFAGHSSSYILMQITVPDADRLLCLRDLNRMNINHLSLFPDLYGASKLCNMEYEIDNY